MGNGNRKIAFPAFREIIKAKSFSFLLLNPLVMAGTDIKMAQMGPETVGVEWFAFAVATPGPTVERVEMRQEIGGENLAGARCGEAGANVLEQLRTDGEIGTRVDVKDPIQS